MWAVRAHGSPCLWMYVVDVCCVCVCVCACVRMCVCACVPVSRGQMEQCNVSFLFFLAGVNI